MSRRRRNFPPPPRHASPAPAAPRRRALVAGAAGAFVLLVSALAFFYGRSPVARIEPDAERNILVITIDTLRADAVGAYGGPAATPVLDALAARGLRFDFAHAHAVMTLPSHASILTGLYPYEHGIRDNSGYRLRAGTPTLASLLQARGYATGAFVGAFPLDSQFGLDAGFDVYDDALGVSSGPADLSIAERPATDVVERASAWIGTQSGRWLAWVHVFDPHAPYAPPAPFDQQYAQSPYHGEVAATDRALAPLLDRAAASTRPTLVMVTADHGEALGEHGELTHGLFAYESTLRVPLVIAEIRPGDDWRTPHARGRVVETAVRHVDLLPTVLASAGIDPPRDGPGRALLPDPGGEDRVSYFEAMTASLNRGWAPLQGVVAGREKYIELPIPELYDLGADPREEQNLAERQADRRRVLEARLRSFGAAEAGERVAESGENRRRLQALGYVTGSAPRKAIYSDEDDPKRLVALDRAIHEGVDLFERGRPAEAMERYRSVIARRPDMEIAYRHLAFLYWTSGDLGGAIESLRAAKAAGVNTPQIDTQIGTYLAESGAPAEAIPLLERASAANPDDVDALNALGIAYARVGQSEGARAAFERILGIDPGNAMAWENVGTVRLQEGELGRAREAFERALALAPRAARAHAGLGVVELKTGNRDAALSRWARAVDLDPTDYDSLYNLGTELVAAGRHAEARPHLERFARNAPPAVYARDIEEVQAYLAAQARSR